MHYLIYVLVASAVGIAAVVIRNRPRTGMDASIDEFRRGLQAIAPESEPDDPRGRPGEQGAGRSG